MMLPTGAQVSKQRGQEDSRKLAIGGSAFHEPRRPHGLVCCPPPSCHFLAYCTGGLANLFREIRTNSQPRLHDFGKFTTDKGRFRPRENMPLLALRYRFTNIIAEGQSCIVIKALDTFQRNSEVSIKILHLNYCKLGTQEMDVIRQLNQADSYHFSSVLRLQNTFMFDDHFCLVFDHYSPVSMMEHVRNLDSRERLDFIRKVAARLVLCLGFLQSQNVIHADVKADNILLAIDRDPNSVRLVDFGNAIHCVHNEISLYYTDFELQTLLYRAPEVMFGLPFGTEVDMWSLGMVLGQLYLGRPLIVGKSKAMILKDMVELLGPLPRTVFQRGKFYNVLEKFTDENIQSESVYKLMNHIGSTDYHFCDFLAGLLTYDPKQRTTPRQAACHSFLAPVLGFAHLGANYPSLPITTSSYKHSPAIHEDIRRRHLSSAELLRVGTKPKPAFQPPPIPKVTYDRLELLRNRKRHRDRHTESRDCERFESGKPLKPSSDEQIMKSSTSYSDVDFAADISSVSDTSLNSSSELGYVSSSSSEIEYDFHTKLTVGENRKKARSKVAARDENFNYRTKACEAIDETIVKMLDSPKIPSKESVFERYREVANSGQAGSVDSTRFVPISADSARYAPAKSVDSKRYAAPIPADCDPPISADSTPKLKGLKFDSRKSSTKKSGHVDTDKVSKLFSPNSRTERNRTSAQQREPPEPPVRRSAQEPRSNKNRIPMSTNENKSDLFRVKGQGQGQGDDSDDSDDTALLTSDVESISSKLDEKTYNSAKRPESATSVQSGPATASKAMSPAGHRFERPQPAARRTDQPSVANKGIPRPPNVAESLVSGIIRSTPIVKPPNTRKETFVGSNLPNFGNISPIADRAPEVSCKRNLPFTAESKITAKRKRSTGAAGQKSEDRKKKSVKLGKRSLLIHEVFGDVYDFEESAPK